MANGKQPQAHAWRAHLTNIAGLGATQLVKSLLPELEKADGFACCELYLPDSGELAGYVPQGTYTTIRYRRRLPNAVSRLIECTIGGHVFDGEIPLLVLGDLPINCRGRQTVFVQTAHLAAATSITSTPDHMKYLISRQVFRANLPRAAALIVQTASFRDELARAYPNAANRIHVIPQPPPDWLLQRAPKRRGRFNPDAGKLSLIYPAAAYPHKNHSLLARITSASDWPVESLALTLEKKRNPSPQIDWIRCVGRLDDAAMVAAYETVDALLFFSRAESYGLPLVEAMWCGLPIVCSNMAYARCLCGDGAIYFDPEDAESLRAALHELQSRLSRGWWPDWSQQLAVIPKTWGEVAARLLSVVVS